jgi:hypothetical protein
VLAELKVRKTDLWRDSLSRDLGRRLFLERRVDVAHYMETGMKHRSSAWVTPACLSRDGEREGRTLSRDGDGHLGRHLNGERCGERSLGGRWEGARELPEEGLGRHGDGVKEEEESKSTFGANGFPSPKRP